MCQLEYWKLSFSRGNCNIRFIKKIFWTRIENITFSLWFILIFVGINGTFELQNIIFMEIDDWKRVRATLLLRFRCNKYVVLWILINTFYPYENSSSFPPLNNTILKCPIFQTTEGFLTPDSFHSTSLASLGSSWVSKEAKFIKEFDFLGFSRCFSAIIKKTSKMSKIEPNCVILRWFFLSLFNFNWKTVAET